MLSSSTAAYVINHPEFGWQAFGGNVKVEGELINVKPLDFFRECVYLGPYGLWLRLDAGLFAEIDISSYEIPEPNPGRVPKTVTEYRRGPNHQIIDFVLKRY